MSRKSTEMIMIGKLNSEAGSDGRTELCNSESSGTITIFDITDLVLSEW